jgi:ankyrin repeat protein
MTWLQLDDVQVDVKDNLRSPLHLASAHGPLRVAQILVQRGASVNVFNGKQNTPVRLAAGNLAGLHCTLHPNVGTLEL